MNGRSLTWTPVPEVVEPYELTLYTMCIDDKTYIGKAKKMLKKWYAYAKVTDTTARSLHDNMWAFRPYTDETSAKGGEECTLCEQKLEKGDALFEYTGVYADQTRCYTCEKGAEN